MPPQDALEAGNGLEDVHQPAGSSGARAEQVPLLGGQRKVRLMAALCCVVLLQWHGFSGSGSSSRGGPILGPPGGRVVWRDEGPFSASGGSSTGYLAASRRLLWEQLEVGPLQVQPVSRWFWKRRHIPEWARCVPAWPALLVAVHGLHQSMLSEASE